jgi:hypothetical protein
MFHGLTHMSRVIFWAGRHAVVRITTDANANLMLATEGMTWQWPAELQTLLT